MFPCKICRNYSVTPHIREAMDTVQHNSGTVQDRLALCHCTTMREPILSITRCQDDFEFWNCRLRFILSVADSDVICKQFYHFVFLRLFQSHLNRKKKTNGKKFMVYIKGRHFFWVTSNYDNLMTSSAEANLGIGRLGSCLER
jgi:hypothetical protein